MPANREHDKWLERMLRRSVDAPAAASGICLDAETLAAWADGALGANALAAAEIHASNCSRCMALLAAIERTAPAVPVEPRSRGALFRWLVPLAAAATAIAIWVAIPGQQGTPVAREEAASPSLAAPPSAESPPSVMEPQPAPPPAAVPRPNADFRRQRGARLDELSAGARDAGQERKEANAAVGATAADQRAVAPPAAPAPPASTDAFSQRSAAPAERRALNETVTVTGESAAATDPLVRWRSVSGRYLERSTDGGQSWTKTAANPPGSVVTIRVVDALNATVTTSDGRTFSTTDGGATWVPVQEKPAAPF